MFQDVKSLNPIFPNCKFKLKQKINYSCLIEQFQHGSLNFSFSPRIWVVTFCSHSVDLKMNFINIFTSIRLIFWLLINNNKNWQGSTKSIFFNRWFCNLSEFNLNKKIVSLMIEKIYNFLKMTRSKFSSSN